MGKEMFHKKGEVDYKILAISILLGTIAGLLIYFNLPYFSAPNFSPDIEELNLEPITNCDSNILRSLSDKSFLTTIQGDPTIIPDDPDTPRNESKTILIGGNGPIVKLKQRGNTCLGTAIRSILKNFGFTDEKIKRLEMNLSKNDLENNLSNHPTAAAQLEAEKQILRRIGVRATFTTNNGNAVNLLCKESEKSLMWEDTLGLRSGYILGIRNNDGTNHAVSVVGFQWEKGFNRSVLVIMDPANGELHDLYVSEDGTIYGSDDPNAKPIGTITIIQRISIL